MKKSLLGIVVVASLGGCGGGSGTTTPETMQPAPGADATAPVSSYDGAFAADTSSAVRVGEASDETSASEPADAGATANPALDATAPGIVDAGLNPSSNDATVADAVAPSSFDANGPPPAGDAGVGWDAVPAILARIVPPTFRQVDCVITDAKYGGVGDGKTDNTAAFASAIADCAAGGGGRVVVPAGNYSTGAIVLQSNINLYLADPKSIIVFSTDTAKYLPLVQTSFEGTMIMNYHPFISASGATNIAITGSGVLEGNATANDWYAPVWSEMTYDQAPRLDNEAHKMPISSRVYGDGHYLRPSLIEFMSCHNILLDGFTAQHSPFWTIHPVMSTNITGSNLKIYGTVGNTDGFDPESCVDVLLKNLTIQVGDDSIAIKAGRDLDGRTIYTPTKNVVIQGCHLSTGYPGHGGAISVGSEMSAGVSNVYIDNVTYTKGLSNGLQAQAIYLKGSIYRGGGIQDVYARNLTIDQIPTILLANGQYDDLAPTGRPVVPITFGNVNVDTVTANSVTSAFQFKGADSTHPVNGIHLSNITVAQGTAFGTSTHYTGLVASKVTVNGSAFNPPASAP